MALIEVVRQMELVAKTLKSAPDAAKTRTAIRQARGLIDGSKKVLSGDGEKLVRQLDTELSTWESKLSVILNEPAGRQGMAKHALYWAEQLKKIGG